MTKGQKLLGIVTNRFDVSPNEVTNMYQACGHIELFFKHLKQNVTIKQLAAYIELVASNQVTFTLIATVLICLIMIELNVTAILFQLKRSTFLYLLFEPVEDGMENFDWLNEKNTVTAVLRYDKIG